MKKILAFAGSNSSKSINKKLIDYASTLFNYSEVKVLDLSEYDAPVYSPDIQNKSGIPDSISKLLVEIKSSDAFVISTPEHNGMMTTSLRILWIGFQDWTGDYSTTNRWWC